MHIYNVQFRICICMEYEILVLSVIFIIVRTSKQNRKFCIRSYPVRNRLVVKYFSMSTGTEKMYSSTSMSTKTLVRDIPLLPPTNPIEMFTFRVCANYKGVRTTRKTTDFVGLTSESSPKISIIVVHFTSLAVTCLIKT